MLALLSPGAEIAEEGLEAFAEPLGFVVASAGSTGEAKAPASAGFLLAAADSPSAASSWPSALGKGVGTDC